MSHSSKSDYIVSCKTSKSFITEIHKEMEDIVDSINQFQEKKLKKSNKRRSHIIQRIIDLRYITNNAGLSNASITLFKIQEIAETAFQRS